MNSPKDSLDQVLSAWRVRPRRDEQFRTQVWARIAAGRPAESWTGYLRGHAGAVAGVLALAVVLGAIGGRSQARARVAAESDRLATTYVQALDARSMRMP
jgi:hypothetical protein